MVLELFTYPLAALPSAKLIRFIQEWTFDALFAQEEKRREEAEIDLAIKLRGSVRRGYCLNGRACLDLVLPNVAVNHLILDVGAIPDCYRNHTPHPFEIKYY